jgi:predicted nuclease of predicted toxin-antitoxin system
LRGRPDEAIYEYARAGDFVIVTGDLGFGNVRRFPIDSHHGIVIARYPNEASVGTVNEGILAAMKSVEPGDIKGHLLIIQPGRIRLKKS